MWVGHRTIDVLWENSDFIHWQALLFSENECRCFSMLKSLKTFMAERGHGVNKLVTGIMKGIQFICLFRAVLFERALLCLPQANPRDLLEKVFQWNKKNHARPCSKPRASGWQSNRLLNTFLASISFPIYERSTPYLLGGNTTAVFSEVREMPFKPSVGLLPRKTSRCHQTSCCY